MANTDINTMTEEDIENASNHCPNCGGFNIDDPDDQEDYWKCRDCKTLIDVDGDYAYF